MRLLAVASIALVTCLASVVPLVTAAQPGAQPLVLGVATSVNLNTAFSDLATGELRGVGADLIKALAAQMGADIEQVLYPTTPAVLADLNSGTWELSVQPGDQARGAGALYAGSYMLVQQSVLVAEDSPFQTMVELDQPGVRIVVNAGAPADAQLSRLLQRAELIRNDLPGTGAAAPLFSGDADAYAFNREGLLTLAEQRPGYRVVGENFAVTELGIAVVPNQPALRDQVSAFLEEAKASGVIAEAISANGVRGVEVAGPGQ